MALLMFCGARFLNLDNNCDKGVSLNMDINLSTHAKCLYVDHWETQGMPISAYPQEILKQFG